MSGICSDISLKTTDINCLIDCMGDIDCLQAHLCSNRAQVLPNGWMLLAIAYSCHAQDGSKQIMQICFNTVPADNGWSHGRRKEKVYIR